MGLRSRVAHHTTHIIVWIDCSKIYIIHGMNQAHFSTINHDYYSKAVVFTFRFFFSLKASHAAFKEE